jgi:hypothetical protein
VGQSRSLQITIEVLIGCASLVDAIKAKYSSRA